MGSRKNLRNELENLSEGLVKMQVTDILEKYNINPNSEINVSKERKKELKQIVERLKEEVNNFTENHPQGDESSSNQSPLRELIKEKKKHKGGDKK